MIKNFQILSASFSYLTALFRNEDDAASETLLNSAEEPLGDKSYLSSSSVTLKQDESVTPMDVTINEDEDKGNQALVSSDKSDDNADDLELTPVTQGPSTVHTDVADTDEAAVTPSGSLDYLDENFDTKPCVHLKQGHITKEDCGNATPMTPFPSGDHQIHDETGIDHLSHEPSEGNGATSSNKDIVLQYYRQKMSQVAENIKSDTCPILDPHDGLNDWEPDMNPSVKDVESMKIATNWFKDYLHVEKRSKSNENDIEDFQDAVDDVQDQEHDEVYDDSQEELAENRGDEMSAQLDNELRILRQRFASHPLRGNNSLSQNLRHSRRLRANVIEQVNELLSWRSSSLATILRSFQDVQDYLNGQGDNQERDTYIQNIFTDIRRRQDNIIVSVNFSRSIKFMAFFLAVNTIVLVKLVFWESLMWLFL